jgi:hypothetical protein
VRDEVAALCRRKLTAVLLARKRLLARVRAHVRDESAALRCR